MDRLLILYIILGLFTIFGYATMISKYRSNVIWSNNEKNIILKKKWLKYLYIFMILLSFIAGPYMIYYLVTSENNENIGAPTSNEILIYVGLVLFLVCSAFWAFFPFDYNQIILEKHNQM